MKMKFLVVVCVSLVSPVFAATTVAHKSAFFIGNSITQHLPAASLSWNGAWGMAATARERDYVSLLTAKLGALDGARWGATRINGIALENNPVNYKIDAASAETARKADLVVVELGDNFQTKVNKVEDFDAAYRNLLRMVVPKIGKLVCVGTWWHSDKKDEIIRRNCVQENGIFVDLSAVTKVSINYAQNERAIANPGVGGHPGDQGMAAIAEAIFSALDRRH